MAGNHKASYDVMIIDPPWPKRKGGKRAVRPNQTRKLDYETMSLTAIEALLADNIFPQLSIPGTVFMWAVDQFLWDAEVIMRDMGFKLHARIIWNKLNGPAPAFTIRYAHEYLLWFYRPRMLTIAATARGKYTDVLVEKSLQHSRKPDAAYELINSLYPTERKLDVFARRVIHGWDGWGDQYEGRVEAWPESVRGLLS